MTKEQKEIRRFIRKLCADGERSKLMCVKQTKEKFGFGLKEAKEYVDEYFYYPKEDNSI